MIYNQRFKCNFFYITRIMFDSVDVYLGRPTKSIFIKTRLVYSNQFLLNHDCASYFY